MPARVGRGVGEEVGEIVGDRRMSRRDRRVSWMEQVNLSTSGGNLGIEISSLGYSDIEMLYNDEIETNG